jgi:prepilin-type processing-associated H-X9-DG protein
VYRLREKIERFMITDINNPAASAQAQSAICIMFDTLGNGASIGLFNHIPGGYNVLYMDGHVEFVKFPGKGPIPYASYKAGVRRFPELVPDSPDAPGAALSRTARTWWKEEWDGKSLMAIGMKDPVLGPPAMRYLHGLIRNCLSLIEVPEAGHFVQKWGQGAGGPPSYRGKSCG